MDVLASARHNIHAHSMTSAGQSVVVAVSGGPDSVCLLHVLRCLAGEMALTLHVAHLNHGLRGADSDGDAAFVATLAQQWGIAATIERADVRAYRAAHGLSLEDAARQVRYAFLRRVAVGCGASAIAVGHSADDQVETILMHWLRGAGLTGLRGMLPVQSLGDGMRVIRPLLDVTRSDIEAYCAALGLQPRQDMSNSDERLWRNRLRRTILPLLEQHSPHLRRTTLRTASILADDDACLEDAVTALWPSVARAGGGAVHIDTAIWRAQHPALRRRIIRRAWACLCPGRGDLSWLHVERISDVAMKAGAGAAANIDLPHAVRARSDNRTVVLSTVAPQEPTAYPLLTADMAVPVPGKATLPGGVWVVETVLSDAAAAGLAGASGPLEQQFDADAVGESLLLRRWQAGDRMQPLGMVGTRKLHDIMIDARVAREWRAFLPVLVSGERIVWLVGVRRSDWGKLTTATTRVVTVRFVRAASAADLDGHDEMVDRFDKN